MIIFLDDPRLISIIQDKLGYNIKVFNMSSLYSEITSENIYSLARIIHPLNQANNIPPIIYIDTLEFDINYANEILNNNPKMFEDLMKIMMNSHEGYIVIILVYRDAFRDSIMESLIKLIQQRYGYNSWIVNDIDDIDGITESTYSSIGLITLEEDIKRYRDMYSKGLVDSMILQPINIE